MRDLALEHLNPQGATPVSKESRAGQYLICFITNWSYHSVCWIKTAAVSKYCISSVLSFSSLLDGFWPFPGQWLDMKAVNRGLSSSFRDGSSGKRFNNIQQRSVDYVAGAKPLH